MESLKATSLSSEIQNAEGFQPVSVLKTHNAIGILSAEEPPRELVSAETQMLCHVAEDSSQRPDTQGVVRRDRHVMLAAVTGRQAHVAASLTGDPISDLLQRPCEIGARQVARQLHAEITSSRAKCRRITLGDWPSSKWQRTASRTCAWIASTVSASTKIERPSARAT
jgi:hypothetical protein